VCGKYYKLVEKLRPNFDKVRKRNSGWVIELIIIGDNL
jgi:hypothetical protein